jgi:hypothetical protein
MFKLKQMQSDYIDWEVFCTNHVQLTGVARASLTTLCGTLRDCDQTRRARQALLYTSRVVEVAWTWPADIPCSSLALARTTACTEQHSARCHTTVVDEPKVEG